MRIQLDTTSPLPIYAQLVEQIRKAIAGRQLQVGEQLPTVRQLAVELRINPNTVARVYAELERLGLITTMRGRGTFVSDTQPTLSDTERESKLRKLAHSTLAEAQMLGFTADDLTQAIRQTQEEEERQNA